MHKNLILLLCSVLISAVLVEFLVAGTLPQHRVTKLSPRPVDAEILRQLFLDSLTCW